MYNYQGGTVGNTALFLSFAAFLFAFFGHSSEIEVWEGLMRAAMKYICLLIFQCFHFSPPSQSI